MESYKIKEINDFEYKLIVFSTDYISPFEHLTNIEENLKLINYSGKIIFDLLLVNGNTSNRFMEVFFDGNEFDKKSFRIANKLSNEIKNITSSFYSENICIVENSRLSNPIKFLIKKNKLPFDKYMN
ncbi:type II toxin-antitoxin system RnlB family antitoxin [Paraclostridium dentum]|uniref:type II toxin-antitoxin system RnlB family antitoxin n=1 Tax=Paraclostridium dentum TaxID=2662455 RepID=UPI001474CDF5|nr:type II toxin-antitoxin system RnlB family antitoxin [Paraclostridium dentum]